MIRMLEQGLGIHEQALGVRSRRMELIARNIANADTPHYKAQDLDFKVMLKNAADNAEPLRATHSTHFDSGSTQPADALRYRIPFNSSLDGNTVELNVEQAQYGRAAAEYQATLSFLESRVSGLRKALRGD